MGELADRLARRFLVLDGPDGSGKSTQLALLAEFLRGQGLTLTVARDPGGTAIGDAIRQILLDKSHGRMTAACETMLYMASRTQLAAEVIQPALAAGHCVLCDRWASSTVAYQAAGGVAREKIDAAYRAALGDFGPDLTIILDLPAEVGLARVTRGRAGGHDRMEAKGDAFHRRVRELFLEQAAAEPRRFRVIDASGDREAVQAALREAVLQWRPA